MSNPNNTRPTTPINNLFISAASHKTPNYQEILTSLTRSPKLSQILKKANTSLADVQFITFEQFLQQNNLTSLCNDYFDRNDHFQRYQTQLERRVRQLQILLEMQSRHFQKRNKNISAQKSSRCKIQTPRHKKYEDFSNQIQKEIEKDRKAVKFTSQSHKYEQNHLNSRKSHSLRKTSLVSSRYSRQNSSNRIQTYKRMKQVEIFQAYSQGRPYIEQYYNQLKHRMKNLDDQKLKTMPQTSSRGKMSRKVSKAGKIKKQTIQNISAGNQYENSFTQNNKELTKNNKEMKVNEPTRKSTKKQFQDNQYAMIPMKNEKIKERLSRKKQTNIETETCRQLVTEVKKYEELNQRYIKKLRSIDKNDKHSREKLFEASSRDKFQKKRDIEQLKNRISSKGSRKQVRY